MDENFQSSVQYFGQKADYGTMIFSRVSFSSKQCGSEEVK